MDAKAEPDELNYERLKQLTDLQKEYVKAHNLYLAAQAKLNEARTAEQELRRRILEMYEAKERKEHDIRTERARDGALE